MSIFSNFNKAGMIASLQILGEKASIGGDQFVAAFDDTQSDVSFYSYGEDDVATTNVTFLMDDVTNAPTVGEHLLRIERRITYVIQKVEQDRVSYTLQLKEKNQR